MAKMITNKLYGQDVVSTMNDILKDIVYMNYDVEQICKKISSYNESIRVGLYLMALESDYDEIAIRISNANKILNEERKNKFLKDYEDGEVEKFLSFLGRQDKISLMSDLGIDGSLRERAVMSKDKKDYYKLISDSIFQDQEYDRRNGLDRLLNTQNDA